MIDGFSYPSFDNDRVSLEDLETQIDKESLICFSSIDNKNVNTNNLNLEYKRRNNTNSLMKRPKNCVVCAKPAKFCHFDVPSCSGCFSFFRRSILDQHLYVCKNFGNCRIEEGEFCRSCRFDRCLLGGMNFRTIQKFPNGIDVNKISALLTEKNVNFSKKLQIELLQFLLYSDDKLLHIRYSETDISPNYYHKSMSDILNNIDGGGLSDSILAKSDMFSKRRRVPKSFDFFIKILNEGTELLPRWFFIDSFLIIEMTKTMPVLGQLSFEDKIHLYSRNGLTAIVFSMLFYSKNLQGSDVLISPAGMSPILIKHDETSNLLFYKHLIRIAEFNLSREEFLILRVLILLHTATTELSKIGIEIIHNEIEKLSKTLMFYEQHKWGDAKGAERFANLVNN
uniref:Nuclear receptor n=1 Tax=Meloidogyne floridensis TaxID=298350 RepID=A0A915NHB4_9BILA